MPDNFFPILDAKREKEFAEKIIPSGCKTTQMTAEQLEYYKSLPYEEATKFLNQVMKGENPVMKIKLTREALLKEAREHGTDKEARELIAEKYGTTPGTVSNYLATFKIIKQIKAEREGNMMPDIEQADITKEEPAINEKHDVEIEGDSEKRSIPYKPVHILKPILLQGKVMQYQISNGKFMIGKSSNASEIEITGMEIDDFIAELKELKTIFSNI